MQQSPMMMVPAQVRTIPNLPVLQEPKTDPVLSQVEPHAQIDKKSKISKIAAQLAMLRKKHK